jgi:phospholipase C
LTDAMRDGTTRTRILCAAAALLAAAAVVGLAPTSAALAAAPCGTRSGTAPAMYRHVIVIMEENRSYADVLGGPGSAARRAAPYLNQLAGQCGVATNYRGATHPSHPNYMAVTGGVDTTASAVTAPSIFSQVRSAGGTWRVYQGSMAQRCQRHAAFPYKPQHNPGLAYTGIAADCKRWDTNMNGLQRDIASGSLPTYAFIAADQCKDMELACTRGTNAVTTGDNWLRTWIPRLLNSRGYRTGHTAIFITWDEGTHGSGFNHEDCVAPAHLSDRSCHVATLVLSPYVSRGLRSGALFSHYSLLQTTERLLGLRPFIGNAADATTTGMRSAFGF